MFHVLGEIITHSRSSFDNENSNGVGLEHIQYKEQQLYMQENKNKNKTQSQTWPRAKLLKRTEAFRILSCPHCAPWWWIVQEPELLSLSNKLFLSSSPQGPLSLSFIPLTIPGLLVILFLIRYIKALGDTFCMCFSLLSWNWSLAEDLRIPSGRPEIKDSSNPCSVPKK